MLTRLDLRAHRALAPIALTLLFIVTACGSSGGGDALREPTRPLPLPRSTDIDADLTGSIVLATMRPTLVFTTEFEVERAVVNEDGVSYPPIDAVAVQQRFRASVGNGILGFVDRDGDLVPIVSETSNDAAREEADKLRASMAGRDPMQDLPFTDVFIPLLVTWRQIGDMLESTPHTFTRRDPTAALLPILSDADVLRGGDIVDGEVGLGTLWCARMRLHYPVELTGALSLIVEEMLDAVVTDGLVEHRKGAAWIRLPDAIKPEAMGDGPLDIGHLLRKSKLDPQRTLPMLATELGADR